MHTLAWRPALWYISKYTPEKADYCACAQSLVRIPLSLSHRDSHVAAWAEREKHKTELVPALQHSWEFICRVSSENLMYDCVHQPLHLWWCWTLLSAKPSPKNVKGICRRKHAVFLKVMTILFFSIHKLLQCHNSETKGKLPKNTILNCEPGTHVHLDLINSQTQTWENSCPSCF